MGAGVSPSIVGVAEASVSSVGVVEAFGASAAEVEVGLLAGFERNKISLDGGTPTTEMFEIISCTEVPDPGGAGFLGRTTLTTTCIAVLPWELGSV